jgi:hypothetical protein
LPEMSRSNERSTLSRGALAACCLRHFSGKGLLQPFSPWALVASRNALPTKLG